MCPTEGPVQLFSVLCTLVRLRCPIHVEVQLNDCTLKHPGGSHGVDCMHIWHFQFGSPKHTRLLQPAGVGKSNTF